MRFLFGFVAKRIALSVILISLFMSSSSTAQVSTKDANWMNLDTVKAGKFDTGKMWTFEYPPMDYFSEAYNFKPDESWFEHVRMSALRFANVSKDCNLGLTRASLPLLISKIHRRTKISSDTGES